MESNSNISGNANTIISLYWQDYRNTVRDIIFYWIKTLLHLYYVFPNDMNFSTWCEKKKTHTKQQLATS